MCTAIKALQRNCLFSVLIMAAVWGCGDDSNTVLMPDAQTAVPPPIHAHSPCAGASLRADLTWRNGVRERLQTLIDATGCRSDTFVAGQAPVALIDWDNT